MHARTTLSLCSIVGRIIAPLFVLLSSSLVAQPLKLISWNLESGESDINWVANKIKNTDGVELWGLCEVPSSARSKLEEAAEDGEEADFGSAFGTTGGEDRMMAIYSNDRFESLGVQELHDMNLGGNVRAPLVVRLRDRASSQEFFFVVNHLYRGNAQRRHQQATMLNTWAKQQSIPVVTVGDFNFDWEVVGGETKHDKGYDNLTANGVFRWVRPASLVRTQFGSNYTSVLDFVFLSDKAAAWTAESTILVEPGDEPDDNVKSDHRPVSATIAFAGTVAPPPPPPAGDQAQKQREIRERLDKIEQLVREIRDRLPPAP